MIAVSVVSTLLFTTWLGTRLGLSPARSLLLGTAFATSGASAIAATRDTARADDEDVAAAAAMVILFGTATVVLLPLLAGPLGLSDLQFGAWAGAGIHDVGQVVLAATPAGAAVAAIAVAVKLTRVVLLAPVVAVLSLIQRARTPVSSRGSARTRPMPLFILGFLACVALRNTGIVPEPVLDQITHLQLAALGAAVFGVGCSIKLSLGVHQGRGRHGRLSRKHPLHRGGHPGRSPARHPIDRRRPNARCRDSQARLRPTEARAAAKARARSGHASESDFRFVQVRKGS